MSKKLTPAAAIPRVEEFWDLPNGYFFKLREGTYEPGRAKRVEAVLRSIEVSDESELHCPVYYSSQSPTRICGRAALLRLLGQHFYSPAALRRSSKPEGHQNGHLVREASTLEDIIALKVTLDNEEARYFLTWGRLAHPVDPSQTERLLWNCLSRFSLGGKPVAVSTCTSLQDASDAPYFHEAQFEMVQQRIPFGDAYSGWAAEKLERMKKCKEFWYLGKNTNREIPNLFGS